MTTSKDSQPMISCKLVFHVKNLSMRGCGSVAIAKLFEVKFYHSYRIKHHTFVFFFQSYLFLNIKNILVLDVHPLFSQN